MPEDIPFEIAAAMPATGFTAYQAIVQKLKPDVGKSILIQGGAGGVGSYATQIAKKSGLRVITTCLISWIPIEINQRLLNENR